MLSCSLRLLNHCIWNSNTHHFIAAATETIEYVKPLPPWTVTELKLSSVVLMVNGLPDPRACTWDLIPVVTSLLDNRVAAKFMAFSSFCKELFEITVFYQFFNLTMFLALKHLKVYNQFQFHFYLYYWKSKTTYSTYIDEKFTLYKINKTQN